MWYLGSSLLGVIIAIAVFFLLSAMGPFHTYLDLQAASDFLHQLVLLSIPGILIVLLLIWMFSELGRLRKWLRTTGKCLNFTCWGLLFALITFVICFDTSLEAKGLSWIFFDHQQQAGKSGRTTRVHRDLGPTTESSYRRPIQWRHHHPG